ncbi:putative 9-cis-epoxycarotenoid dioxygenase [Helianthus annuus]|uniref:9-cis-epoxycarotenoid dioxygenase n=1 Tax=Helianthus annuus TaxID=4232 RepID=A0A9K3DFU1_HELAN|nr:putative 9-cis-epoxycarotenoid dioxygenase [Helianthus annuus]KAJ0446239.1 putative 9-cis-epoxycarotenoid dioxygenase [Helianthus annuus]
MNTFEDGDEVVVRGCKANATIIPGPEWGKAKYGGLAKLYFEESNKQRTHDVKYHWLPKNNFCTGLVFVAKPESTEEDDGWIVTFAHDEENDTSYVLVVDAKNFGEEPIAKIKLPQRVPYGFHGSFFTSR